MLELKRSLIIKEKRETLGQNMFLCRIFIDLQKAFDTVNHDILFHKLDHYGNKGLQNKWFQSFKKLPITPGAPQGLVLRPLLFILYINDINKAIIYSYVHHFADDTNLAYCNKSLKINKNVSHDLKQLYPGLEVTKSH